MYILEVEAKISAAHSLTLSYRGFILAAFEPCFSMHSQAHLLWPSSDLLFPPSHSHYFELAQLIFPFQCHDGSVAFAGAADMRRSWRSLMLPTRQPRQQAPYATKLLRLRCWYVKGGYSIAILHLPARPWKRCSISFVDNPLLFTAVELSLAGTYKQLASRGLVGSMTLQ
jgi:hypothetical protein